LRTGAAGVPLFRTQHCIARWAAGPAASRDIHPCSNKTDGKIVGATGNYSYLKEEPHCQFGFAVWPAATHIDSSCRLLFRLGVSGDSRHPGPRLLKYTRPQMEV